MAAKKEGHTFGINRNANVEADHGCGTKGQRKRSDEIRRFRSRKHHILKARQAGSLGMDEGNTD